MLPSRTVRVLVVDTRRADALLLASMLATESRWSFDVEIEPPETAAERLWTETTFDAVVVGGDVSGGELVRMVRSLVAAGGRVPIISACDDPDELAVQELARAGSVAVLQKSEWTTPAVGLAVAYAAVSGKRHHRSARDPLTDLPTRTTWMDRVQHAIERSHRSRRASAVLLIDVDDFKRVNDTLGHDGGDRYLKEIAHRLRSLVRQQDTVARLGGDEFAMLLEDLAFPEVALQIATKVVNAMGEPVHIDHSNVPISLSIGVAILTPENRHLSPEWAQRAADAALYESKRRGKGRFSLFTDDMDRELLEAIRFDDEVVSAVERNEFSLHYQPIIDLNRGHLEGFEALLRWTHGPRAGVSPSVFVPTLERVGLMDRVGCAVFTDAIHRIGQWQRETGHQLTMHVNLSASQLVNQSLPHTVSTALAEARVPASSLVIELTESLLFENSDLVARAFSGLRAKGVRLAIDDFGTGYNSLVNLKHFKPEMIKVDRGFIDQLTSSDVDAAIVRAQAVLAESLGIGIVAEGVEREEHLLALQRIGGIHQAQGYLLGAPMSVSDLESMYRPFAQLRQLPRAPRVRTDLYRPDGALPGGHRLVTAKQRRAAPAAVVSN